jgi:hypothetical protein
MIDGFTTAQIIGALFGVIGGLIVVLFAMIGAFAAWIVRRFDRMETKLDGLTIAVSRLEGAVYHGLPEPHRAASQ